MPTCRIHFLTLFVKMVQLLVESDKSFIAFLPIDEFSNAISMVVVVTVGSIIHQCVVLLHILD